MSHKNRPPSLEKGGGICMIIKKDVIFSELLECDTNNNAQELMGIEVSGRPITLKLCNKKFSFLCSSRFFLVLTIFWALISNLYLVFLYHVRFWRYNDEF